MPQLLRGSSLTLMLTPMLNSLKSILTIVRHSSNIIALFICQVAARMLSCFENLKSIITLFFLFALSFLLIHEWQYCRGRMGKEGREAFIYFLTTTSTRFTDTKTLAKWLLERANLCTYLAFELEPGTLGLRVQVIYHNEKMHVWR